METAAERWIGAILEGRYVLDRVLGVGGMGVVYRGHDRRLGTAVAVKVLRSDLTSDPNVIARFRKEAHTASAIGHPHIVRVLDFGELPDGAAYFVMEHLEGLELGVLLASEGPLPIGRAVGIARQLCDALVAAHSVGIVHRDLKPENVFLVKGPGDEEDFVKILDFGIAKVAGASERLTIAGQLVGTPHYMSPEQAMGRPVDHRSDVYQVGTLLFEMLTGRTPFDGDSVMSVLNQKTTLEAPRARLFRPDVPPVLEEIVGKALAREPLRRFASMREMRDALVRVPLPESPRSGMRERIVRPSERPAAGPTVPGHPADDIFVPSVPPGRISSNPPPRISSNPPPRISSNPPAARASFPPAYVSSAPPPRPVAERRSWADSRLLGFALGAIAVGVAWLVFSVVRDSSIHEPGALAPRAAEARHESLPRSVPSDVLLLRLRSTPAGAYVLVGDRSFGPTPADVDFRAPEIRPGAEVTFRFVREGYVDHTVTRVVPADSTLAIDVQLQPASR